MEPQLCSPHWAGGLLPGRETLFVDVGVLEKNASLVWALQTKVQGVYLAKPALKCVWVFLVSQRLSQEGPSPYHPKYYIIPDLYCFAETPAKYNTVDSVLACQ